MVLAHRLFFAGKTGAGCRARQKETAMSGLDRKTIGTFLVQLISVVALALFMAPSAAVAKPRPPLHDSGGNAPAPESSRQKARRTVKVCLNESGDLVIRRSDDSQTSGERMNYPSRKNDIR